MIDRDYFSHTIPGYGKVWDKLAAIGYCYHVGWREHRLEQLPRRPRHGRDPDRSFMGSPDHKANILGTAWDVIGIGAYKGSDGKKMWTVLFADKCGSTTSATPKPTAKPTPRPTPRTDRRTDDPPAPADPTPRATTQAAATLADARGRPGRRRPSRHRDRRRRRTSRPPDPTAAPGDGSSDRSDPRRSRAPPPTPTPTATPSGESAPATAPSAMRVIDRGATDGLLETIVGGVAGFFFGG